MIQINLLPSGDRRRPPAGGRAFPKLPSVPRLGGNPWTIGLAAAGVGALLLLGYGFWTTGVERDELRAQLDREVADSTRFASTIQLVASLEARQDTIAQKIGVIRSVDERRYVWPHLLSEVSRATPDFTWLTRVGATEGDPALVAAPAPADSAATGGSVDPLAGVASAPPAFNVEGNAGSTQALTRFMKNLESSPFVRDVTLVTSEQTTVEGRTFQKFTLEARYETPDSAFIETVPVIGLD